MEAGEEEEDLEAIQAHLDMTMALTYEAVEASFKNSTLPDEMVYETIDTFKPRPPRRDILLPELFTENISQRLGVGATRRDTTANGINSTTMARETARLHGRLAGKKRGRDEINGDANASATTNGLKRMHLHHDDDDSEEEEGSRATTIASKQKDKANAKPLDKFAVKSKQKPKGGKPVEGITNGNSGIPTSPTRSNPFSTMPSSEDTRFIAPAPPKPLSSPTTSKSAHGTNHGNGHPTSSSSTSGAGVGDMKSPPESPPRVFSPAISRSMSHSSSASRNSRHSRFNLSRRMMLQQQANASWRIISVEPASRSPPPVPVTVPTLAPTRAEGVVSEHMGRLDAPKKPSPSKVTVPDSPSSPAMGPTSPSKSKKQSGVTSQISVLQLEPLDPPSVGRRAETVENGNEGVQQSQKKKRKRRRRKKNNPEGGAEVTTALENDGEQGEEDSD